MRVKLTSKGCNPRIVNADTDEPLTGVASLHYLADINHHKLVLILCDFDVDITDEAEIIKPDGKTS